MGGGRCLGQKVGLDESTLFCVQRCRVEVSSSCLPLLSRGVRTPPPPPAQAAPQTVLPPPHCPRPIRLCRVAEEGTKGGRG